jgi:thiazole synthase
MWTLCDKIYSSRLILGETEFKTPEVLAEIIETAGIELLTVSACGQQSILPGFRSMVESLGLDILPDTEGCHSVKEAMACAQRARDHWETHWIKLDIAIEEPAGHPDHFAVVSAAGELMKKGFEVFPCIAGDLAVTRHLVEAGCRAIMVKQLFPGMNGSEAWKTMRRLFPDTNVILGSGLCRPSQATRIMELGWDGVLVNQTIASARDPLTMAEAFAEAVLAGRAAHEAGLTEETISSSGLANEPGLPFWHIDAG